MYYDPDLGSYSQYDDQLKTYTLHSRVDLPECQMRRKQPEREVEIILIDEDELSGQFLVTGGRGVGGSAVLCPFAGMLHRGAFMNMAKHVAGKFGSLAVYVHVYHNRQIKIH